MRCNAFHQRETCALALRVIPYEIPGFDELGTPAGGRAPGQPAHGARDRHRPDRLGEVDHPGGDARLHQPAPPSATSSPSRTPSSTSTATTGRRSASARSAPTPMSFERALRSVLREDPDVLLVGEMRDLESIATTLTIAETGHLVFATLHTNDSGAGPGPHRRHLPLRSPRPDPGAAGVHARGRDLPAPPATRFGGGLVAAYEVLMANHAVRNLVREGKTRQLRNVITTHQSEGMQTLEMSLTSLVADGLISHEMATKVSLYPKEIEALVHPGPGPIGRRAAPDARVASI